MRVALIAASAVAVAIATGSAASAQSSHSKDAFTGTITSSSGRLASDRAKFEIDLAAPSSRQAARRLTLTFHGRRCAGERHCVKLTGRLTGTLTPVFNGPPDTGRGFTVHAAGRLMPLGHVRASGTVHGTGFIARGHITMALTLSAKAGKLTVTAQSGPVRGFTSP